MLLEALLRAYAFIFRLLDKSKDEKVLNPVKFQDWMEREQKVGEADVRNYCVTSSAS